MDKVANELIESIEKKIKNNIKQIKINNFILVWISTCYSCIKHKSWIYENEIRCIMAQNAPGLPYINAKPSAIYWNEFKKKELFNTSIKL